MKTFETEKNNIPKGATHYSDETKYMTFCWFMFDGKDWYLKGEKMQEWSHCTNTDWVLNIAKPIPQTKEVGAEDGAGVLEWKNGDKCIYEGNLYDYQCVSSWDENSCILSGASPESKTFTDAWIDELSRAGTEAERIEREELEAAEAMVEIFEKAACKQTYSMLDGMKALIKAGYTKEGNND